MQIHKTGVMHMEVLIAGIMGFFLLCASSKNFPSDVTFVLKEN